MEVYVPREAAEGKYEYLGQQGRARTSNYFFNYGEQQVKGRPLDFNQIPEKVYHVTTNLPAVLASGKLMGIKGGKSGLGGNARDQFVSVTTDSEIARQLKEDLVIASEAHKLPHAKVYPFLQEEAKKYGFEFVQDPIQQEQYIASDFLVQFFSDRARLTGIRNPVLFGGREEYARMKTENIGVIEIDRDQLDPEALATDYDSDNPYGLKEIRYHGEIPVTKQKSHNTASHTKYVVGTKPRVWKAAETSLGGIR